MSGDPFHGDDLDVLVHLYEDGAFNRRELIGRLAAKLGSRAAAVSTVAALGIAEAQSPACPAGVRVAEGTPGIVTQTVTYPGQYSSLYAYIARPANSDSRPQPGMVVIHENRGLTEHQKDLARRFALAGYVGMAIDLLSRQGGSDRFPDPVDAARAYGSVTQIGALEDLQSSCSWLFEQRYVQGDRIGAIGFCAGGGHCFNLAVNTPDLAAAVVFYGMPPNPISGLADMKSPLLAFYGALDRNFTGRVPAIITTLNDARKNYGLTVYENAAHAFFNDTSPSYLASAACDAWPKTLDFLTRWLRRDRM